MWLSHILVKHNASRNPSSWREKNITRSKETAKKIIVEIRKRITEGEHFGSIASKLSDCDRFESHCARFAILHLVHVLVHTQMVIWERFTRV